MDAITIHTNSKEQTKAFELLAKVLNIPFEKVKKESPYKPEFIAKIKRGEKASRAGKGTKVNMDTLWRTFH